jgi:hypothetical protein
MIRRSNLERAVLRQDEKEVERLLAAGEKPPNEEGVPNLLHKAASLGNVPIARMMLDAGLDIHSITTERGRYTPLHTASSAGSTEMISFLLSRGAELDREAHDGITPFLLAVSTNNLESAQHLLSLGANIYARGRGKSALKIATEDKNAAMVAFLEAELEKRKWAGVFRNPRPELYLLAGGHGSESLGERTRAIPTGTTLITVSQCGDAIFKNDLYDSLSHMFVPEPDENAEKTEGRKEMLLNPLEHLFDLEEFLEIPRKTMRVHPEGTPCPNLSYNPLADFPSPGGITLMKSGTYKYPINGDDFFMSDDDDFVRTEYNVPADKQIDSELVAALFKDSLYPNLNAAQKIFKGVNYNPSEFGKETRVHIYDLMTHLGPGTYYFFACRSAPSMPLKTKLKELAKTKNEYKPLIGNILYAAEIMKADLDPKNITALERIRLLRQDSQKLQNSLRKTPKNNSNSETAGGNGTGKAGGRRGRKTRRNRLKRKN